MEKLSAERNTATFLLSLLGVSCEVTSITSVCTLSGLPPKARVAKIEDKRNARQTARRGEGQVPTLTYLGWRSGSRSQPTVTALTVTCCGGSYVIHEVTHLTGLAPPLDW